jgi:hypothetical protein
MNLYEIEGAIMSLVDEETGEVADYEALEALEMERDKKISNLGCFIKNLRAEAAAIKAEKMALAARQQAVDNHADRLEEYLSRYLNGTKYEDGRVKISFRKSESVEIDEGAIDELPARFIKVERSVMKTPLKDALKGGQQFEGCRLVTKQNIQIK